MKSFRKIMICVVSICMLSACSAPAKSVSISDAYKYLSAEQFKEAIDAFSGVIAENPDSAEAYAGKGDAYAYSGEYIPAAADYAKAVQLDENNTLYLLKSAVLHNLINEKDVAEKNLKKAIESGNGTITSWDASEVTDLITKLKAADSAKAVLDFISTAAKEDETAAVPASETPKAAGTPTPAPAPTPDTKPKGSGTLADIKNLDELLDCIASVVSPMYYEQNSEYMGIYKDAPYDMYCDYYTVKQFKTVDEYRNHYKKYMTDDAAKSVISLSYRFAVRNGKLYSLEVPIGFGGMNKKGVKLKEIDQNGDYIIRIPYLSDGTSEVDYYDEYRLRYEDGKFVIAGCLSDPGEASSGYVVVNTNHLNIRKSAGTSSAKIGRLNKGAILDVYETKKDSKYTWYKVGINWISQDRYAWIADNGKWLKYVKYD